MAYDSLKENYKHLLKAYIEEQNSDGLQMVQNLSKRMIESSISPEEVVCYHIELLSESQHLPMEILLSLKVLTESMEIYGTKYRELIKFKEKQNQLHAELDLAAQIQRSLLPKHPPSIRELDFGVIYKAAKKMSGDFYHFIQYGDRFLSLSISDVVGKGIPAALCMSMIKYGIDGLHELQLQPASILARLNDLVLKDMDPGIFITMMYGVYDSQQHIFHYASAGHEPGLVFRKKTMTFDELSGKGLMLGVMEEVKYGEYTVKLDEGDLICLFTDGVIEVKANHRGYIDREELITQCQEMIKDNYHLSAQEVADQIYQHILQLSRYELHDDFTLLILSRKMLTEAE